MQKLLKIVKKYGVTIEVTPDIMDDKRLIDIVVEKHTNRGKVARESKTINMANIDEKNNNINNIILEVIERVAKRISNNIEYLNEHDL